MNTYYGYLDADERASLIEETKIENELSRLETMYEMVELKLKQMENDVHLKVLTEAGTYDDYAYLMTEAEAAVAEEKKGILSTIWKALKDFFATIGNAFRGLSKKGDPNDDLKVSEQDMKDFDNASEKVSGIINGINQIKTGIQNHSKDQVISGAKAVISSPIVISATVAGGVVGGYKVIKRQVLQGKCDQFAGLVDKVTDIINQIEQSAVMQWLQSAGVKIVNDVKSALNSIKTGLSTLKSKITSILTGTKTDDGNNNQPQNNGENGGSGTPEPDKNSTKTIKGKDGYTYTIDKKGNTTVKDKNGNSVSVNANNYPPEVKSAIKGIKGDNAKAASMDRDSKGIVGSGNKYEYRYNSEKNIVEVFDKNDTSTKVGTIKISDDGKSFTNISKNAKSGKYKFKGDDIDDKIVRTILSRSSNNKSSNTSDSVSEEEKNQQRDNRLANIKANKAAAQNAEIIEARFGGKNNAVTKNVSSKGKTASVNMQSTGYITIKTSDGATVYINKDMNPKDIDDKCKSSNIDKGLVSRIKSAIKALNNEKSSCDNAVAELKKKFDEEGLPYTESGDDFDITESFSELCEELENNGYTVIESGDDLIISPSITTEESIFGEFVESSIDDIIFEDRYEQELYDLAEKFANL